MQPASERASEHTHVELSGYAYDVIVEPGVIARAGQIIRMVSKSSRVGVVADDNTAKHWLPALTASLNDAGFEVVPCVIPSGESNKTLDTLLPIYDTFLRARFERTTPVIALGGGVVGDMTGFVAATLLRGVPFVQVPTTLLAMVDASVGGKTGVDHAAGKNLIGAFHQPSVVIIDPNALTTLPARELKSGLAECIKHDIIRDAHGFADLEANIPRALQMESDYLTKLIAHNVRIKANVVMKDPFEIADRAHLNFGHTFGHAIETVSNYSYTHGESIALGMCAACHAAAKLLILDKLSHTRIINLIQRAQLPISNLKLDVEQVIEAMYFDKKVRDGRIRFVLPDRIGNVVIRDDLPRALVAEAVTSLQGN